MYLYGVAGSQEGKRNATKRPLSIVSVCVCVCVCVCQCVSSMDRYLALARRQSARGSKRGEIATRSPRASPCGSDAACPRVSSSKVVSFSSSALGYTRGAVGLIRARPWPPPAPGAASSCRKGVSSSARQPRGSAPPPKSTRRSVDASRSAGQALAPRERASWCPAGYLSHK